ncbi:hypothetical protein BDB00DRAFT_807881 [Zychaea mexicana]|uniref:uncharacterized protein n=1 Tax=Zychaea mexicana TaxID=64656 RepID=UPI0022FE7A94|nr:uncharacterized protein BDB00DRAFT_807881 [Zychaea mexicana]KAI9496578.1 hypothetical protein BDB00DRAFT_807881 [Zychaea mexicana]
MNYMQDTACQPQLTMMELFPFDIVVAIFSHLSQQDCLNAMAVCRNWCDRIPQYTEDNWRALRLSRRDINGMLNHRRRSRCLGKHVKCVNICSIMKEHQVLAILRKLLAWGCTEIESLAFKSCSATMNQDAFLDVLRQLANRRLTHLTLTQHGSNIGFVPVLQACPQLTHFTYKPTNTIQKDVYKNEPSLANSKNNESAATTTAMATTKFDNLIYLHIDTALHIQDRLEPILQKCPNLQYLLGASSTSCDYLLYCVTSSSYNGDFIDLDKLLSWCPKLVYVSADGVYQEHDDDEVEVFASIALAEKPLRKCITDTKDTDDEDGNDELQQPSQQLCHLATFEHYGYDQISQILRQNQDKLEYLLLSRREDEEGRDWSPVFRSLDTPCLQTLDCEYIEFDTGSIVNLLNTCRDIQTINLHHYFATFTQQTVRNLHTTLHQLHSLRLTGISFADEGSAIALLQRLPSLKVLIIQESRILLAERAAMFLRNLKQLELWNMDPPEENTNGSDIDDNNLNREEIEQRQQAAAVILPSLFESLSMPSHESKLEIVRLVRIPTVNTRQLLLALAHIPTLKHIDIRLSGTLDGDDDDVNKDDNDIMLKFVLKLRERTSSSIEQLVLRHVGHFCYSALDALGDFPQLRKLDIRFPPVMKTRFPKEISLHGISQLLRKSKSLETAEFGEAALAKHPPKSTLEKLLREEDINNYIVRPGFSRKSCDMYVEYFTVIRCHKSE